MDVHVIVEKLYEMGTVYGLRIIAALAILFFGRIASQIIRGILRRVLEKSKVDGTLTGFICNLSYAALLAFVVIAALNKLGVQTASFIAVIGAAGLAIGLALQGSLANFAAGFLMILFRPFKAGDYIEGGGAAGTVEEIQIFTTQMRSPDNKTIIIPNAKMMSDNIVNYSAKGTRRVDMVFGIGYGDDIDKARSIVREIVDQDERVMKSPETVIYVSELADSSVNLQLRAWTSAAEYWNVYFETMEAVKKRFDENGVNIPFPQRDVHLYDHREE